MSTLVSPFFNQVIRNWQPASDNLFEVRIVEDAADFDAREYATLHCSKVRFGSSGVEFTRNKTTRKMQAEGYQAADEVTITWREDRALSVRTYHEQWQSMFYNRDKNHFISTGAVRSADGSKGRLKTFTITIQDAAQILEDIPKGFGIRKVLVLEGVCPPLLPELELDWASGNAVEYTLTYKVQAWYWED